MTYYPCDVCGIERCGGCCSKCRRDDDACICADRLAERLKEYSDMELRSELKRREEGYKENKKKLLKGEIAKLQKQLKELE